MGRDFQTRPCVPCDGSGQVDELTGQPWPLAKKDAGAAAVNLGIVKPKACAACQGKGVITTQRREVP